MSKNSRHFQREMIYHLTFLSLSMVVSLSFQKKLHYLRLIRERVEIKILFPVTLEPRFLQVYASKAEANEGSE